MRAFVACLMVGLSLAGCMDADPTTEELQGPESPQLYAQERDVRTISEWDHQPGGHDFEYTERARVAVHTAVWVHNTNHGYAQPGCSLGCQQRLSVVVPEGDFWLEARVRWDGALTPGFDVRLEGPGNPREHRGFDSARHQLWAPESGEYTLTVTGQGMFWGWVRLFEVDGPRLPGSDRLPNLVTLAPNEIGVGGCLPEEQAEQQAERCLRLGNAVANMGDGPLEVHLDYPNGVLSAGGVGRFVQRIYGDDGFRDVSAGPAQFHLTHSHFHYYGLAEFRLYEHDLDTGLRGSEVGRHMKQGFCFLDWGPMNDPEVTPEDDEHAQQNCLIPDLVEGWSMGISVGWYDFYWAGLADQYVDISGVPDGVYELVSIADGGDTLLESDERDNAASAIIRLTGDSVDVLEKRAFYDNPEG